jgi:ABC-type sugar transport system permease subunit
MRLLASVLLGLGAIVSMFASIYIRRRQHRGRMLSLTINYLVFVICLLWGFNVIGVYTGIDSLADTFGRGLPYLGVAFLGYLITAFGARYEEDRPALTRRFNQVGKIFGAAGGVLFLIAVGILPGLLSALSKFTNALPFVLFLGVLLLGVLLWMMFRAPTAQALGARSEDNITLNGFLFLSPNLLGFLFFFAGPLVLSLYISFTDSDAFGTQNWIGLANYAEIFNLNITRLADPSQLARDVIDISIFDELTRFNFLGQNYLIGAEDKLFWIALSNTLKFVIAAVPFSIIPALLLANILNSKIPGMTIYRAVYFIPSIAAVVGVALIWRWLYNSTVGYINYFITSGIDFVNSTLGSALIQDPEIGWLSDTNVALFAVVIIAAWQWMGFNTVLFLAGLQNIPKELYEAATVDGAGSWAQFWRITLPLLAPTTFFVVTTTSIQAMQIFDQVFILTIPPGGPGTSTTTMVLYLYTQGFRNFRQGYASAIAWVLFLLIFGLTLFQFQRQRSSSAAV